MEKLHPFDSSKWGSIVTFLRSIYIILNIHSHIFNSIDAHMITNDTIIQPNEAKRDDLLLVHTKRYLSSLNWSIHVARVLEVPPIAMLPNFLVQWRVLKPLRYQTGGTILVNISQERTQFLYSFFFSGRKTSIRTWLGDQYWWRFSSLFI